MRTCESNRAAAASSRVLRFRTRFGAFAHAVDGLDCSIEGLEEVRAVDERALPAAFQVEVVERGVAEIDGERTRLEAGEDRFSGCVQRAANRHACGRWPPVRSDRRPRKDDHPP